MQHLLQIFSLFILNLDRSRCIKSSTLNRFDIIVVSPTVYGKSCLIQLLPGFLPQSDEMGIVIVVPSLIDQLNTLKKLNIKVDILTMNLQSQAFFLV